MEYPGMRLRAYPQLQAELSILQVRIVLLQIVFMLMYIRITVLLDGKGFNLLSKTILRSLGITAIHTPARLLQAIKKSRSEFIN